MKNFICVHLFASVFLFVLSVPPFLRGESGSSSLVRIGSSELRTQVESPTATVREDLRLVMEYRFTEVPFKPYIKQWTTPSGVQVLRDSPQDHKHHHALMFAIAADGVDFWAETPGCGKEVHRSYSENRSSARDGLISSSFSEQLDWISPKDEKILSEDRTIGTYSGGDLGASLITWRTALRPADGRKSVRLTGSHYFGLGIRFVQSMDKGGAFTNSTGKWGPIVRGDERVTPANWCAYTAQADGKPVTIAMFDHPKNPRHPATFFTMSQPFSYISATLNLWKEPMTLDEGKVLDLTYGVAAWDGKISNEQIEKLYQRWIELENR